MTDKPPIDPDMDALYDNRAAEPNHPAIMARWAKGAEAYRAERPPVLLAYGSGDREAMDLFEAGEGAPVAIFIHGGYWQALDRSWFSWIAKPLAERGISVAIPSYDLAPGVRLGRIVTQMREAVGLVRERTGRRPMVFGHSAGGHLAACLLSEGRVSGAMAISGLFDLAPLIPTKVNVALGLDAREAAALSPIHWPVPNGSTPGGTVLDCVVGADETAEFVRQSRMMADRWGALGVETRFDPLPGRNHFTVLDDLADGDSALVRRIEALARAS